MAATIDGDILRLDPPWPNVQLSTARTLGPAPDDPNACIIDNQRFPLGVAFTTLEAAIRGAMAAAGTTPSTLTQVTVSVATASTPVAAADPARRSLVVHNRGTEPVFVNWSGAAATVAGGIRLDPGATASCSTGPANAVTAISPTVATNVVVVSA